MKSYFEIDNADPNALEHLKNRFWSKVDISDEDKCWEWQAGIGSAGRGNFSIGRENFSAHRMSWMLTFGEIPDGLCICHHCDNGKCVNPTHLFLGTYRDNVLDMHEKGRDNILCGEDDPKSKLTEKQVLEIRNLWKPFIYSQFRLAKEYGVSRSTIEGILHRNIWKHI